VIRGRFANSVASCGTRALRILGPYAIMLVLIFQLFASIGLRINTSPSLPIGFYLTTSDPAANLVEFCPPEPYARLTIIRRYRDAGSCEDGAAPLLKPLIAKAGDLVETSSRGIAINGRLIPNTAPASADSKGRPLTPWPAGSTTGRPGTYWVASSYNARSFDSRYFGPIERRLIRNRLRPLLTR
jgi:conjugative transfer signal peptidase TraF